ncbi:DNA sulfur modification protein DndD [Sphingomonas sp. Leaf25]|uniref:DNA sulfur modification protein DndD n=1 Tax=Sphingomonas sp. Leaf25 TaxID=1735692 RepID=UPI0006FD41E3|nr:DNA sulfur modification protein DndD [Sphingomonas sp. Leaf25]KQM98013.1 hypothetical protein ASE78_07000 [Sphingomonas sp. Leaf25]
MIIDELTVHDFGVYAGRQTAVLTPHSQDRPIILFGGLNGAGKTTLLDALQLGLFGTAAAVSNRSGGSYDDYLRRSIHRRAPAPEAAIEVAFRHVSEGRERSVRLHRSWSVRGERVRERFEVLRDGKPDALAAEHWAELVEEILPARIAELFLFDGEKIEAYADLEGASRLIRTAIENLLGLDVIEQLATDLLLLERRKRTENRTDPAPDKGADIAARLETVDGERKALIQRRAAAVNEIERLEATLRDREEAYRREGGGMADQRLGLEAALKEASHQTEELRHDLREIAAGVLPLALTRPLLDRVQRRWREQDSRWRKATAHALLVEERAMFREMLNEPGIDGSVRLRLLAALDARDDDAATASEPTAEVPTVANDQLAHLLAGQLDDVRERAAAAAGALKAARTRLADVKGAIDSIPAEERLAPFAADLEQARRALADARVEQEARAEAVARFDREVADLKAAAQNAHDAMMSAKFATEDLQKMLSQSVRVRESLVGFRKAVLEKHASRIEAAILQSFHELARKRTLIAGVRIDPANFSLELVGRRGDRVTPERLSAGERQILAVAVLWGLARASGRPLPTVIDTPLGRLDSAHRGSLISRYFPHVSHQTILLSTDEEIAGRTLAALRPSIGRSYRLVHDEAADATRIEDGELETANEH